jgi:hypothetical protein
LISLLTFSIALVMVIALAGCGGGEKETEDAVLATVGEVEITVSQYEDRLKRLAENELPRGEDGMPEDMSLPEGKKKFLETMANKEIMVQTANRMGFPNDPKVVSARNTLLAYESGLILWDKAISDPGSTISPEELEAFYAKMGSTRKCLYVVTNFKVDAETAREKALAGTDWEDIVAQFHDGMDPPDGVFEITVPFGRYTPEFEKGVYGTEIGGITPIISSIYGYWVLKVIGEKEGKKPDLEEAKAQILDITHLRKMSHLKDEFKKSVMDKFELTIHEEALWKCYQALPQGETLFQDGTQTPRAQEELRPLAIATEDMDLPFYSYLNREGVKKEFTLLDYKIHFDKMSVFQRPKDTEMLGGLRNKIRVDLEKILLNFEAEDRGLYEDPEVKDKVDLKIEEMMVSKLYMEVITIDERVTPEQLDAFWAENHESFNKRESRSGRLVIARNEEEAAAAQAKALGGAEWRDILLEFGTNKDNKAASGKLEGLVLSESDPTSSTLFALEVGQVSEPFALAEGRFGVVRLDSVEPESPRQLSEITELVGQRIREIRKEEVFQAKLAEWREISPVTIFEENLDQAASWKELTALTLPENMVPRN